MKEEQQKWTETLKAEIPLLGHRNWIVITDMAYPLQSKEGIETIVADKPYSEVIDSVCTLINKASHIYPHIYQDNEFQYLNDNICPGVGKVKKELKTAFAGNSVTFKPHEDLIKMLDEASQLYKILLIKTSLTIPYTTVFFQLDCKYWDDKKQAELQHIMSTAQ